MLVNIMLEDLATYRYQRYGTVISRQGTVSLKIGAMLACDQESGSLPVSSDFWKIICRTGANSLTASCRILAGISSGPVALFGLRACNSLATPSVVMMMSDIGGMFVLGSCGK